MKRSRFSEAQIAFVLKQVEEGAAVGEVCPIRITLSLKNARVEEPRRSFPSTYKT
jgi:hypothetical protein